MLKPLKENTGVNFHDLELDKRFLTFNTGSISNNKIEKLDFTKIKNFCTWKETIKKVKKDNPQKIGENICKSYTW